MNLANDNESPAQETFRKKRLLWCSEPDWQNKEVIDYCSDTLYLLCNDDDEHCLELSVGGKVVRLPARAQDIAALVADDFFKWIQQNANSSQEQEE